MNEAAPKPESQVRRIGMLAFDDCDIIDVCGPMDVFAFANYWLRMSGQIEAPVYRLAIFAERAGPVRSFSGMQIVADHSIDEGADGLDTLLVAGGPDVEAARRNPRLIQWIQRTAQRVRRIGSVCTGAFLLGEAGILAGHRATTHWAYCERLAEAFPDATVEPDRIFVSDGEVYSSGGVTSGIDLAFHLVEEDWGHDTATATARGMVMFPNRPGGQTQFSRFLMGESKARHDFRDLLAWIDAHAQADLSVEALAQRMCMSPRHFARMFDQEIGMPPAKYVERARLAVASFHLEQTLLSMETIAKRSGFGSAENLRRSFQRNLKVSPQDYRQRFRAPGPGARAEASTTSGTRAPAVN
jgi:transcriptional regulator GlxA family with amidase domain